MGSSESPSSTSMTRATVEDNTASLGQTPRSERPLVGGLSFHDVSRMCTNLGTLAARRNSILECM